MRPKFARVLLAIFIYFVVWNIANYSDSLSGTFNFNKATSLLSKLVKNSLSICFVFKKGKDDG